jgi:hypothetical protein
VEATSACAGALVLDGVRVGDYVHYVHLVLRKPGTLSDKEVAALWNVVDHMKGDDEGHAAGVQMQCEVAIRTGDVAKLQECTATLAAATPNDPATLSFEWALALRQGHKEEATKFLEAAKTAGLSDSAIKAMQDEMASDTRRANRGMLAFGVGFVILLAAGIAGFLVRSRRRAAPVPA